MADFPPPAPTAVQPPVTAALIVYALFGITAIAGLMSGIVTFAPLLAIVGIVGVIIAYVKRDEARGTWLASHFDWLISTFWWSLLWSVIIVVVGGVLILVLVGLVIIPIGLAIVSIWVIYRLVRGFLAFNRSEALPG